MPNSTHNPHTGAAALRTYLQNVLPDATLTDAPVDSAYQPLLLMRSKHVIAAFAFSNGEMRTSYETLYGSFKTHYASQRGNWDALDLAFVFCVDPEVQNLDVFCSEVETDVYFCRKFVVPLAQPLGVSLSRLPFLPLAPIHGPSLRPASAQTFLQQCGVPATLAKFLAVQKERSEQGIIEDCLSGEFGKPRDLTLVANNKVAQSDRTTKPARLESVTIQNFRAYRRPQTFAIGADVTVLYGPNGFGKTSFFDAIDFAVTGGIGRFEPSGDAHFKKTAQHLDSKSEASVVSFSFERNGVVRKVSRTVTDRKQGLLDGSNTDRKTILAELTSGSIPATDRVENFVSLFRATHLFSQEHQELTKNFQEDCQISSQIVSRMLAFEDYTNAVSKAQKVRDALEATIAGANHEIRDLSIQIAADKKELDRLGQISQANTNVQALDSEIEALRIKLTEMGLAPAAQKPDAVVVRGWRASLEARQGESKSRSQRLASLAREAAGLPRVRAELATLQSQLTGKETAFSAAEEKRVAAELALQRAEQNLAEMKAKSADAQSHADLFAWLRATRPAYAQLREKQRNLDVELTRATEALALLRTAEEQAANDLRTKQGRAGDAGAKLKAKCADLAAIQSLSGAVEVLQANQARLAALDESNRTEMRSLELMQAEERALLPQANQLAVEEAQISRLIAEAERGQSELRSLLSQVMGHVQSGTCPLCGEDHGSKEDLVRRIQEHVAVDATSGARAELGSLRDKTRRLAERIAGIKQRRQSATAQIVAFKHERAKLDAEIGQFLNGVAQLGVVIEASEPPLTEQLNARHDNLKKEIGDLNRLIQELGFAVDAARASHATTRTLVATKVAELADRKTTLERVREDSDRLRDDPRLTQVSIDISDDQLTNVERLNLEQMAKYKAEAANLEREAAQKRTEVGGLRQELTSLRNQIATLRTQTANLQNNLTQLSARLGQSQLPPDASPKTSALG
jgi:exonuclease SbcC